jgi:hypothetical protein
VSALAEQHQSIVGVRARLGFPVTPEPRVRLPVPQARVIHEPAPLVKVEPTRPATKAEILAFIEERDETLWRDGVRGILRRYGETMVRLISHQRDQNIIDCRLAVAIYLRQRGWSFPRIGQVMNRDHSSIVHLLDPSKRREAYRRRTARGDNA